ncbi:MAG: HD-GYP domain-containing protein [Lachnospiraceae bacterium]|nr:HD-GYP domain-containing protein [Lachnospiraceae bacterium]
MLPVDYTNLRGGTYTFVMTLHDSLGRGNKEISVRIIKEKAFYEQVWFYLLLGLIAAALLVICVQLYIRWRMRSYERKQQQAREQFEQTAEALASAIDAKDTYTNGHSRRVAEYSEKIARSAGKSEEECEKVYFAALLHDVGKIGVPIDILTKKGRLTDEEFEAIKEHPVAGGQILSKIKNSPWLGLGANYHHERYNGKGYPEGRKGEDIPEIARIIAVADAYDAMTSNRSYRNAIPQHIVREELVKGIGTQFDPVFARIMIHMIDLDTEYLMKESVSGANMKTTTSLRCDDIYHDCTDGIGITRRKARIRLCSQPDEGFSKAESLPSLIVFDSLDGNVHPGQEENRNLLYYEYAQIRLDGSVSEKGARKIEVRDCGLETDITPAGFGDTERGQRYQIDAVRNRDHVLIRVANEDRVFDVILALPDTARYVYIALAGEHCDIHNILVDIDDVDTDPASIPRIAEEISYLNGCEEGDLPSVQIDGPQLNYSEGIPIEGDMKVTFHTQSLPTARLIWHCPYISVFSSMNGQPRGENFREYLILRMDGEYWSFDDNIENDVHVDTTEGFEGWDRWKELNKQGYDCEVTVRREDNRITVSTANQGISIISSSMIRDASHGVYLAFTGDQCVISNIRISRGK